MASNLPVDEPHQLPLPDGGFDADDNFFGFAGSLQDISHFDISGGGLPPLPPSDLADISGGGLPPLPSSAAGELDLADILAIDPFPEQDLSSWFSSAPVPAKPDDVVATGHGSAGDGAGAIEKNGGNGGAEGSGGRRHKVSITCGGGPNGLIRKAMSREMLEELVRVDPKKAKRIVANRVSAAKSKERKNRYASKLKERVKAFEIELASILAELDTVGRDNRALIARIEELKMHIDAMQQGAPLRSAVIEQLRKEVQELMTETGETGNLPNYDVQLPQYSTHLALLQLPSPPPPQYTVPQQPQLGFGMLPPLPPPPPPQLLPLPPSPSPFAQPQFNVQGGFSFFNFNPLN